MPVYGYWETRAPKLYKRPAQFPVGDNEEDNIKEPDKFYVLKLSYGT